MMAMASCTTITPETNTQGKFKQGVPGGTVVQTSTINATVTGIDAANRKVSLVTPDGKRFDVKTGPEAVNFKQVRVGDQFKATLTEEVVVRMAKKGEKIGNDSTASVELAPEGAKPGLVVAETVEVAVTVTKIDSKSRKVTLQLPDGTTKKVKVRDDIDLTKHQPGERVVIRSTEIVAVKLEKP
jgi:hypothetical protein